MRVEQIQTLPVKKVEVESNPNILTESKNEETEQKPLSSKFVRKTEQMLKKQETQIEKANKIGAPLSIGMFKAQDTKFVYQGFVSYTDAKSAKPILGSAGAGPCVIVAMYNPDTKETALCHFDVLTAANTVFTMWYELGGKNAKNIEVHLAGGEKESLHSKNLMNFILNAISTYPNMTIKTCRLGLGRSLGEELAIDTRTGKVFNQFGHQQLDTSGQLDNSLESQILYLQTMVRIGDIKNKPAVKAYDGRGSKNEQKPVDYSYVPSSNLSFTNHQSAPLTVALIDIDIPEEKERGVTITPYIENPNLALIPYQPNPFADLLK